MASSLRLLFTLLLFLAMPLWAQSAEATTFAALQTEFSDQVELSLQEEVLETMEEIFAGSSRFELLPASEVRTRLDADVLDCFTEDCLRQAGDTLRLALGLRLTFAVEAEIYNWNLTLYDLAAGEPILTEMGTCELCGRAEVLQQFEATIRAPLATLLAPSDQVGAESLRATDSEIPPGTSQVRVSVIPEDTRIFLNDDPVGEGSAEFFLPEGTYEIRFSHDTHRGLRETLILSESSPRVHFLRVHLSRPARFQDSTLTTRGDGLIDHIEPHRTAIGASAIGAGAAIILTSYLVGRLHGRPACPGDTPVHRCEELYNTAGLSTTLTALGATSLSAGAVLLTWPLLAGTFRNASDPDPDTTLAVTPTLDRDYAGISLFRRF